MSSTPTERILPGATLGVLGSGQLGRMFAMAATRLGYRVHVYAPEHDAPAADVCWRQTVGAFEDVAAVAEFAASVSVVTLEFENIAPIATETAAKYAPVRPSGAALYTVQDRLREKLFLEKIGVPCTPFAEATTAADLATAITQVGLPAVLKTAAWGYDGKGQALVHTVDEATAAHAELGGQPAVLEGFIDFQCELSMLVARNPAGEVATFGPLANDHVNHILDVSTFPDASLQPAAAEAAEIAATIARELDAIGLMCVEFFWARDGRLLVNEIAPRPHNSGHLTIDACRTSQFEQQVRAICNLPLGSFEPVVGGVAMANLLGDLWAGGVPDWVSALADPQLRLHLYGKVHARPGRKMGHLVALADDAATARAAAIAGRERLARRG
ncbi:MAG: 5-(carboxyamino)imidazole ribonucleotide synthase [Planctomycetales bacterium]|nr:5-(carboxyamino)imidazole ribonucleotide synthase [Planctomycetales bacterium]